MKMIPNNKATKPRSLTCAYCGRVETADARLTDDHVVGRKFVPTGAFATGWSLIVRACDDCNNVKSDLEDDISAITLLPDLGKTHEEPELAALASRKAAKSVSRKTKKPVAQSYDEGTIKGKLIPAVDVSFGYVMPPQVDAERVMQLARYHVQGFFHMITFDEAVRTGGFIPGEFGSVNIARRTDWGNSLQRSFADLVLGWDVRVVGEGANGHFKIAIRREPSGAETWSYALEWNRSIRSIGFFGDLETAQQYIDFLDPLRFKQIDPLHRIREEVALAEEEDFMFSGPSDSVATSSNSYETNVNTEAL